MTFPARDANGDPVNFPTPRPDGRAPAAESRPVALSDEDKAALDRIAADQAPLTALANLTGAPAAGAAFSLLVDADPARVRVSFQNGHGADTLHVIEAGAPAFAFADAAAALAAWDGGGGWEVLPKQPYFSDGPGQIWVRRGGANNIPIRGIRG